MALGICRKKIDLNPELEALRNKGLQETLNENSDWIKQMICKTSRIHAGFLFEDRKTLQDLCLFLSETQNKITDAGWEAFGYSLGLSPSVLKVINYNNFNKEDPCYNVLLAYVQYENATVGKILEALNSVGRIDVLNRIQNSINNLADIILHWSFAKRNNNFTEEDTSDYGSLTSNEGNNSSNNSSSSNIEPTVDALIKPQIIPPAPFIFQNIKAIPELTCQQIQQSMSSLVLPPVASFEIKCEIHQSLTKNPNCYVENPKLVTESHQTHSINTYNSRSVQKSNFKQKYGLKILLTFAEDGEKYAAEVSQILRKRRSNYPKIGVLTLTEHAATVNKDPQQFVFGAFSQVDYVCPILTAGYFNLISKKQKVCLLSNMHIDALFVPYIYRLINSYFISNNCLNDKVRCIVPESQFTLIPMKTLWKNPVFSAWVKLDEVNDLALRLLKSRK